MTGKGIRIEGLKKRYGSGNTAVDALKGVDMQVDPGEVVVGPAGLGRGAFAGRSAPLDLRLGRTGPERALRRAASAFGQRFGHVAGSSRRRARG